MTPSEARAFIGKRVEWEEAHDYHRGTYLLRTGILEEVHARNLVIDGEYRWLPSLTNFRLAVEKAKGLK